MKLEATDEDRHKPASAEPKPKFEEITPQFKELLPKFEDLKPDFRSKLQFREPKPLFGDPIRLSFRFVLPSQ